MNRVPVPLKNPIYYYEHRNLEHLLLDLVIVFHSFIVLYFEYDTPLSEYLYKLLYRCHSFRIFFRNGYLIEWSIKRAIKLYSWLLVLRFKIWVRV